MSWWDRFAKVAGPLVAAADQFMDAHPGAPEALPEGPDGARSLAAAIDDWAEAEDATSDEDEGFLEGAGACLGLLLMAHLGGSHAVRGAEHRVTLGAHGFFDPFAAIEHALDADDGAAGLAKEIAQAEAEASGAAGVGRARRLLEQRLATRSVRDGFGALVTLDDGTELDLSRAIEATRGETEAAAAQAVDKLVQMLELAGQHLEWSEVAERLRPRLVRPGFADELRLSTPQGQARGTLASRPLFGGLLELTFTLSYPGRSRYVRTDELDAWAKSSDAVMQRAIENLAACSDKARFATVETPAGEMVMARTGDGLDGARLLLPTLFDVLEPVLGSPFLVAVPHRDALLACGSGDAELREALRHRARDDAARAPHASTEALFVVDERGPRAL